ncbi:MAG: nucleotide exchange factor GrpE, partial [Bacteroidales bacterium]|nr:nucleotide exchange factor GrpE [Bacteroidales bacterium]
QIAQVAQQAQTKETDDAAEPVNETLQALSDQISAIRQYASSQQDRVEKLQSGYDWNIIRTFCVRVIRCIDNLETRITRCDDDTLAQELGEVHDELLFSLESSGVEQFAPELNSSFCGQERVAEAVKEKEPCTDTTLKGCIAQVVKPGYQYVIDDDNVKIVRTARVKLYGDTQAAPRKD